MVFLAAPGKINGGLSLVDACSISSRLDHSGVEPSAKDFDFVFWPRSIARHRAIVESPEDFRRMRAHIAIRPQIEYKAHRLAIHSSEERLDVLGESHRVVRTGENNRLQEILRRRQPGDSGPRRA